MFEHIPHQNLFICESDAILLAYDFPHGTFSDRHISFMKYTWSEDICALIQNKHRQNTYPGNIGVWTISDTLRTMARHPCPKYIFEMPHLREWPIVSLETNFAKLKTCLEPFKDIQSLTITNYMDRDPLDINCEYVHEQYLLMMRYFSDTPYQVRCHAPDLNTFDRDPLSITWNERREREYLACHRPVEKKPGHFYSVDEMMDHICEGDKEYRAKDIRQQVMRTYPDVDKDGWALLIADELAQLNKENKKKRDARWQENMDAMFNLFNDFNDFSS